MCGIIGKLMNVAIWEKCYSVILMKCVMRIGEKHLKSQVLPEKLPKIDISTDLGLCGIVGKLENVAF